LDLLFESHVRTRCHRRSRAAENPGVAVRMREREKKKKKMMMMKGILHLPSSPLQRQRRATKTPARQHNGLLPADAVFVKCTAPGPGSEATDASLTARRLHAKLYGGTHFSVLSLWPALSAPVTMSGTVLALIERVPRGGNVARDRLHRVLGHER
jgi:hypothetical protein